MKKQISAVLFLFLFAFGISAQKNEVRKFDQFDTTYGCEYERSVIDGFFIELQNNPQTTGFIIYYEGNILIKDFDNKGNFKKNKSILPRYGEANYRIQVIRDHIKLRRYDKDRILFINGGFQENLKFEFWIVPDNAKLPKPTPTLDKIKYRNGKIPEKPLPCPG